mmetsp:Transcript_42859/g.100517  ORF Transcript_42859/g.100517 Transcript_42859/m.100517 type:complete len:983 (-) Transcript_42859:73-3021(-)
MPGSFLDNTVHAADDDTGVMNMFVDSSTGLLPNGAVAGLLGAWFVVWVFVHFTAWPLWRAMPWSSGYASLSSLDIYRRRLFRSQVYCFTCVVGAVLLLSRCRRFPHDLLFDFSLLHQVFFTMSSAHWFVSIWEDGRSRSYLKAGLTEKDVRLNVGAPIDLSRFLLHAYTVHHLIAGLGFAFIVFHKACTGVAVFGLLFELPVLLLNHREFLVLAEEPPAWWNEVEAVQKYWTGIILTFLTARFSPAIVYLYSIIAWRDDLRELSTSQTMVYHFMAIFFVVLNHQFFVIVMQGWYRHDLRRVGTATRGPVNVGARHTITEGLVKETDTRSKEIDDSVIPLARVNHSILEAMNGKDADTKTWIEIDGIAYDVTKFLDSHPGGKAVLKKYAGQDASAAFHKIGHSQRAQMQMQGMAVGPVLRPLTHYRIFEHPDELLWTTLEATGLGASYWILALLLGNSVLPSLAGAPHQGVLPLLLPGFLMSVCGAAGSALLLTLSMMWRNLRPSFALLGYGIALNMTYAGLNLVRRPLPDTLQEMGCPTGVELTAVALWLLEDLLQAQLVDLKSIVGLGLVGLSWHFRGAQALVEQAPEHILAAFLIAVSTAWLCRRINPTRGKQEIVMEFFGGVLFAGVVGGCALLRWGPAVSKVEVIDYLWSMSLWDLVVLGGALQFQTFVLGMLLNSAHICSSQWASRCVALYFALGVLLAGGFSGWRWIMVLGCFWHLAALARRNRAYLKSAEANGTFGKVPLFVLGTQSVWDGFRTLTCTIVWRLVAGGLKRLLQIILPEELTVFALDRPIMNLGDDVDLGVAAHFQPAHVKEAGQLEGEEDPNKPGYIVCNVGHISNGHPAGLNDMQRTMNALRDVWVEFKRPETKGLLSNVVCVFPEIQGTTFAKEINLSTWTSAKEVHEWYVKSKGHRDILTQNNSGYLRTFGSLLASLAPVREVRHQDRCTRCARVVESENIGQRAPSRCPYCNAATFAYPYV